VEVAEETAIFLDREVGLLGGEKMAAAPEDMPVVEVRRSPGWIVSATGSHWRIALGVKKGVSIRRLSSRAAGRIRSASTDRAAARWWRRDIPAAHGWCRCRTRNSTSPLQRASRRPKGSFSLLTQTSPW